MEANHGGLSHKGMSVTTYFKWTLHEYQKATATEKLSIRTDVCWWSSLLILLLNTSDGSGNQSSIHTASNWWCDLQRCDRHSKLGQLGQTMNMSGQNPVCQLLTYLQPEQRCDRQWQTSSFMNLNVKPPISNAIQWPIWYVIFQVKITRFYNNLNSCIAQLSQAATLFYMPLSSLFKLPSHCWEIATWKLEKWENGQKSKTLQHSNTDFEPCKNQLPNCSSNSFTSLTILSSINSMYFIFHVWKWIYCLCLYQRWTGIISIRPNTVPKNFGSPPTSPWGLVCYLVISKICLDLVLSRPVYHVYVNCSGMIIWHASCVY